MIVKIEKLNDSNECNGYVYFQCDGLEFEETNIKNALEKNKELGVVEWIIGRGHENRPDLYATILYLFFSGKIIEKIITTNTIYILNENGKTIDKIA